MASVLFTIEQALGSVPYDVAHGSCSSTEHQADVDKIVSLLMPCISACRVYAGSDRVALPTPAKFHVAAMCMLGLTKCALVIPLRSTHPAFIAAALVYIAMKVLEVKPSQSAVIKWAESASRSPEAHCRAAIEQAETSILKGLAYNV